LVSEKISERRPGSEQAKEKTSTGHEIWQLVREWLNGNTPDNRIPQNIRKNPVFVALHQDIAEARQPLP